MDEVQGQNKTLRKKNTIHLENIRPHGKFFKYSLSFAYMYTLPNKHHIRGTANYLI